MTIVNAWVFTRWAMAGAVAALGLVGIHQAVGQSKSSMPIAMSPKLVLGGLNLKASFANEAWPRLDMTVVATNPGPAAKSVDAQVKLVRRVFSGSMLSRTIRPSDYKTSILETKPFRVSVASHGEQSVVVHFDTRPGHEAKPGETSYMAVVTVGTKNEALAFASPPRATFAVKVP